MLSIYPLQIAFFKDKVLFVGTLFYGNPNIHLNHILRLFNIHPKKETSFEFEVNDFKTKLKSDKYGRVHCVIDRKYCKEELSIKIDDIHLDQKDYIIIHLDNKPNLVISDIDDTLIKSHSKKHLKRIITLLFKKAKQRKGVSGGQALLLKYKESANFVYLSRSEENLYHYLKKIFNHLNLPKGLFLLSPWKKFSNLSSNKSKQQHKEKWLRTIIQSCDQSLILIGDNSQLDEKIYSGLMNQFQSRIKAVYIRQINPLNKSQPSNDINYF
ncbi:DUF2183 domain-containing protein [Flavobacteriaceae bacterium]|nr:DUF2183 domain-containing protein [Flavobacteriaceae bacterium]